ncbi:MAG: alpha/beta hydrolase fold domain-containing protein [Lentisphaeria bacterium]|jgi:acetyl esterase/lipase|nr:alpha/beta hydrolase fold domain-containing protein [Lentisphaeria bacterium]
MPYRRFAALLALAACFAAAQEQPPGPDELFRRLDRNRDGKITKDEVPPERQALLGRIDTDGDGTVSIEEHRAFRENQQRRPPAGRPSPPEADFANVAYGPHPRNVFDLWRPTGNVAAGKPSPLLVFYHGGGFRSGDKSRINQALLRQLRENGVAVAAANYRLTDTAPFPAQMHDAARALQFIRLHAAEYGIDPARVAATGGSAGAGISLWLAFHDDLADPAAEDPAARQSTRLAAALGTAAQSTYDPREHQRLFASTDLEDAMFAFYGMDSVEQIAEPRFQALFEEASPINHATPDDPPVMLAYSQPNTELPPNPPGKLYIHHPKFGFQLKEKLDAIGVECVLKLREDYPEGAYQNQAVQDQVRFLCEKLGVAVPE